MDYIRFVIIFCSPVSIFVMCQEEEIYPLNADIYLGGFFAIYNPDGDSCSNEIDQSSIQEFEAAKWAVDQINHHDFLPGSVKLGIHGKKTCGVPENAAESAISLLNFYQQNDSYILGVISPARSSEAKVVSQLLSSLPKKDRIPMISYGATSEKLNDRSIYKNFFRVIPPDAKQIKVMLKAMIKLEWNYIGIIYERGAYGEDAASELLKLAKQNRICVPIYLSFNTRMSEDDRSQFFAQIDTEGIRGVVYIGDDSAIKWLLRNLKILNEDIEIIASESIKLRKEAFSYIGNSYFENSKGALVTSAPSFRLPAFERHWQSSNNGEWRKLVDTKKEFSSYVSYMVKTVCVFANLIKTQLETTCHSSNIVCSELKTISKHQFINNLHQLETGLSQLFPFIYNETEDIPTVVKFDDTGETIMATTDLQYELYNFRECTANDFCFKKVGELHNNTLTLNKSAIQMYNLNLNTPYASLPQAQCPNDKNCEKCFPVNFVDDVMFVEGDWYVVGVMPIFNTVEKNVLYCSSDLRFSVGVEIAESIRFAIEVINNPDGPFANIISGSKIGLIVLSGCESDLIIKEKILRLHKGTYEIRPGLFSSTIKDNILGYVGSQGGSMSIAVAEVLSNLGFIQVSFGSTSPALSDRSLYPYFMRIPTPDSQQARVILDILAYYDSTYIQVLHNEGSYGEGGLNEIKELALSKGICVANNIVIMDGVDVSFYNKIIPELRKHPYAKVVVTFIRSHLIQSVLVQITESMNEGEFIFVGSETWGRRKSLLKVTNKEKLYGSISVSLELPFVPAYLEYLANQNPTDTSDPWMRAFWEQRGSCIFPGSFNRKNRYSQCDLRSLVTSNNDPDIEHEAWASFAIAATYSVVSGVMAIPCETSGSTRCPPDDPKLIIEYMYKNVKLKLGNGEAKRVFDDNGDGVVDYTIIRTERKDGTLSQYNVIGRWSKSDGLKMDLTDNSAYPKEKYASKCSNDYECNKCSKPDAEPVSSSTYMVATYVLIGLVVLLAGTSIGLIIIYCRQRRRVFDPGYVDPDSIDVDSSGQKSNDIYLHARSHNNESYMGPETY